jgi:hypothetical protein
MACRDCTYYDAIDADTGDCRRYPVYFRTDTGNEYERQPIVVVGDQPECGEFKKV